MGVKSFFTVKNTNNLVEGTLLLFFFSGDHRIADGSSEGILEKYHKLFSFDFFKSQIRIYWKIMMHGHPALSGVPVMNHCLQSKILYLYHINC